MKQFTVKDFITYSGPCFSCQSKISFKIGSFSNKQPMAAYLVPVVTNDFIDIDLKINYNNGLSLRIFTKTNKFTASSMKGLIKYLEEHKLFLRASCDKCHTCIESVTLDFNLLKEFVAPVSISDEKLVVNDNRYLYELYSSFESSCSVLIISTTSAPPITPIRMDLPLLPMYKLKNRVRFIEKVKTYILFS